MSINKIYFLAVLFYIPICTKAQNSNDAQVVAAKAWWHALTFGDTNYIKKNSTNELTVTYSNGHSFTRSQIIGEISNYEPRAKMTTEWFEINKQTANSLTAIITARVVESKGVNKGILKCITVLTQVGSKWKIAAAQSTKVAELSARIPVEQAGKLEDYAGSYRTPAGATLSVVVRDTLLVLTDPSGVETPLEAIGPALFEPPYVHNVGNVRIAFSRDAIGRVTSLNRITNKVITMTRIQ